MFYCEQAAGFYDGIGMGDEAFLAKAPAKVVDGMRAKLAAYKAQRDKLL